MTTERKTIKKGTPLLLLCGIFYFYIDIFVKVHWGHDIIRYTDYVFEGIIVLSVIPAVMPLFVVLMIHFAPYTRISFEVPDIVMLSILLIIIGTVNWLVYLAMMAAA